MKTIYRLILILVLFCSFSCSALFKDALESEVDKSKLLFVSRDSDGLGLWEYDGINNPHRVYLFSSVTPVGVNIIQFKEKLYFIGDDGQYGLWVYDGETASRVSDVVLNLNDNYLIVYNNKLYFKGIAGSNNQLFEYDGTNEPSAITSFTVTQGTTASYKAIVNGILYFEGYDSSGYQIEICSYDGSTVDCRIMDFNIGGDSYPLYLTDYNNKLYFEATDGTNYGLCVYDGSSATKIYNINITDGNDDVDNLTVYNGKLYFRANDGTNGNELWSYDEDTGATQLYNVAPTSGSSDPEFLTVYNGKLYFSGIYCGGSNLGTELCVYDSPTDTVTLAVDINPGGTFSAPSYLTIFKDKLYFQAMAVNSEYYLCKYDGVNYPELLHMTTDSEYPKYLYVWENKIPIFD